jgi:DNA-binding NtrC family response regulator
MGKFREDLYYRLSTVPIYVPALRERGEDMLLLFRKFATDLAEVYRNKPIVLSDSARDILLSYHFPGNIRQLKNIVQQMSVLEMDRNITPETLRKYLPAERNLPALIKSQQEKDDFSERDLLYKVLFDLKKDMNEMKGLVHQILNSDASNKEILQEHSHLFEGVEGQEKLPSLPAVPAKEEALLIRDHNNAQDEDYDDYQIEEIVQEEDEESLSLEKKEKELILKALKRNNQKRKHAAQDLGISERTLYRKIKQYEIDE